jgi:integrase
MGLYKLCEHKGRNRDRCEHPWWGSFRGVRVSLTKWANREIRSKAEAGAVLDEMRMAMRAGTFDARGLAAPKAGPMTFRELAEIYREQHVIPKRLAMGKNYTWSVKPFVDRFGDRALGDIRTADVQDFIADLRKPRAVHRRGVRVLSPSAVNRIVDLLRHLLNWAVGRELLTSTPFKRGSETLIKKFQEDNVRRRRIDEQEEAALLAQAPTHIQALIVAAIDTGMRSGEMLALRFADIDLERGLITLRGETTKSRKTRLVPIATTRLRDVFAWLRRDVEGNPKPLETRVFSNEVGEPYRLFHRMWQSIVLKANGHTPTWNPRLNYQGLSDESQETFRRINLRWARPAARIRVAPGRARGAAGPGARPAGACVDHHDGAVRQPDAGEPAGRGGEAGAGVGIWRGGDDGRLGEPALPTGGGGVGSICREDH